MFEYYIEMKNNSLESTKCSVYLYYKKTAIEKEGVMNSLHNSAFPLQ